MRKSKKASYSIFVNACEKLNVEPQDLCETLGYSRPIHNKWRESQYIPFVASIAIEGLLRRTNQKRTVVLKGSFEILSADDGVEAKKVTHNITVLEV